jgi:hypothetical protein
MRALRGIALGLAVWLGVGGCSKEPPTRPLEGNRGAIRPGGIRTLKPAEPKPPSTPEKP